jgi:hypothetical protein
MRPLPEANAGMGVAAAGGEVMSIAEWFLAARSTVMFWFMVYLVSVAGSLLCWCAFVEGTKDDDEPGKRGAR